MKNPLQSISQILAAGAAGVAFFYLADSRLSAALPADLILAAGASLALVGFVISDYSRRLQPLARPARLLRPAAPVAAPACCDNSLAA